MGAEPETVKDIPKATWLFKFSLVVAMGVGAGLIVPLHRATMPTLVAAEDDRTAQGDGLAIDDGELVTISVLQPIDEPSEDAIPEPAIAVEEEPAPSFAETTTPVEDPATAESYAALEVAQSEESADFVPAVVAESPSDVAADLNPFETSPFEVSETPALTDVAVATPEPAVIGPFDAEPAIPTSLAPVIDAAPVVDVPPMSAMSQYAGPAYSMPGYGMPQYPASAYAMPTYPTPMNPALLPAATEGEGTEEGYGQQCGCPDCCGPRHPLLWRIFHPRAWRAYQ